ncbi:uncharacterized protein B0H18DRAFT_1017134 [Fomitopsis serialis]|uniref:uncharacterized protein n=1 Tax=Fomitopsis serialis TaxID=139415 RepID=UPI0020084788|nr:uncharacterized protein B0H18DRAFT_1017134 [Neoantrodia serialis]KAH9922626.1 hypothetical protein B0H18DRAFT_1017134 [Neoantrodia serialis]
MLAASVDRSAGELFSGHRAILDSVADQLRRAMLCVEHTRNILAPINRLPSEILCMIFSRVVMDCPRQSQRNHPSRGKHAIQTVCRLWRQIAISFPVLWSEIELTQRTPTAALHELLQRAGVVPLQVSVFRADHLVKYIGPHMHRMQRLEVTFEKSSTQNMQLSRRFSLLFQPAPFLNGLHVSTHEDDPYLIMMPKLFQGHAPRLSRLSLSRHYLCSTNRFPNLTHLYLSMQYTFSPSSLEDFLDFLEGSPKLEAIVLEEAGPCILPELLPSFPLSRCVTLSHLRTLVFDVCRWQVIACVLRHVVPSTHVEIEIVELQQLTLSRELLAILAPGAAFLQHVDDMARLSLWFNDGQICFTCEGPLAMLKIDMVLDCSLPEPVCGTLASALVAELPQILPLHSVTDFRLKIHDFAPIWSPAVQGMLQSMLAVQSCTIWIDPSLDKKYWRACLESRVLGVPLPKLKSLHFVGELPKWWKPFWAMGVAIGRAKRGYRLQELTCTGLKIGQYVPTFVLWNPETMKIGRQRVMDFVDKVELRAVGSSPMIPPVIHGWDGML